MEENKNGMQCEPETGICEVPRMKTETSDINIQADKKPVHLLYFTDPICSSWNRSGIS
ncbi:MAG TPA: hypothetical protein VFI78_08045 [Salinimicrobium sp.]|nr:hypothetical protein [Salinimicrobium sp.]